MYKDVGFEIKEWAKFLVVLLTIPYVIVGIAVWIILAELDMVIWGFVFFAILSLFGFIMSRLDAILLYGFGELVDCVTILKNHICGKSGSSASGVQNQPMVNAGGYKTKQASSQPKAAGSWTCMNCGHTNKAESHWCESCRETTKP